MENDLISVIVPVYKTEKYLEKCVNSIINQTYSNLEILLVDDGSPDNSGILCDELSKKDSRIKVIHQKNGGLSNARNSALKIASGKYIGFVDSDDYIDNTMYETLYHLIKQYSCDISIVSYRNIENDLILQKSYSEKVEQYDRMTALKELLLDTKMESHVWDKLFKKSLFDNVAFPDGKNYEDIHVMYQLFESSNQIVFYDFPQYNYINRPTSILNSRNYKNTKNYFDVCYEKYQNIKEKHPELELYNTVCFIGSMMIVYKNCLVYDLDDLYEELIPLFPLLTKLIQKNQEQILPLLKDYVLVIYSLFMWNKERAKPILRAFELERLSNPNMI